MNEFADTYYQRASHLSDVGRWKEAIKEAGMCLAIQPSHYRALCTISRCHYELGELGKALEYAEKAIAADPTQEWAYRLQSAVYSKKDKKKKRLETALQAIKQEPESILALQNLTYAQLNHRKFKEARQTAEKLRQISPDSVESHKTFGYVEFNDSKFVEAEENFRRALKIESSDYNSLNMLGETLIKRYEKTGSFKTKKELLNEAIDCFRQALTINPTFSEAKQNLRQVQLKSIASTPILLLPLAYSIFLLIVLFLNRESSRSFRPEIFNLDNKLTEVAALYWVSGLCTMFSFYGVAATYAHKGISEANRKMLALVDKTTLTGRLAMVIWLIVSTYPLILIIWKLATLNFDFFTLLTIFDWFMFLIGLAALIINVFVMMPFITARK